MLILGGRAGVCSGDAARGTGALGGPGCSRILFRECAPYAWRNVFDSSGRLRKDGAILSIAMSQVPLYPESMVWYPAPGHDVHLFWIRVGHEAGPDVASEPG